MLMNLPRPQGGRSNSILRSGHEPSAPAPRNRVNEPIIIASGDAINRRPAMILSYERHGGHGRSHVPDAPKAQQPWSGRRQLPAVASTDLTPLFVPPLVLAHNLSVRTV